MRESGVGDASIDGSHVVLKISTESHYNVALLYKLTELLNTETEKQSIGRSTNQKAKEHCANANEQTEHLEMEADCSLQREEGKLSFTVD